MVPLDQWERELKKYDFWSFPTSFWLTFQKVKVFEYLRGRERDTKRKREREGERDRKTSIWIRNCFTENIFQAQNWNSTQEFRSDVLFSAELFLWKNILLSTHRPDWTDRNRAHLLPGIYIFNFNQPPREEYGAGKKVEKGEKNINCLDFFLQNCTEKSEEGEEVKKSKYDQIHFMSVMTK